MAEDFRIMVGFLRHPKTRRLKRGLGADGVLGLISLIEFCTINLARCTGDLTGMADDEIEDAADWDGDEGALVRALEKAKYLDGKSGARSIHDFVDHNRWVAGAKRRSDQAKYAVECREAKRNRNCAESFKTGHLTDHLIQEIRSSDPEIRSSPSLSYPDPIPDPNASAPRKVEEKIESLADLLVCPSKKNQEKSQRSEASREQIPEGKKMTSEKAQKSNRQSLAHLDTRIGDPSTGTPQTPSEQECLSEQALLAAVNIPPPKIPEPALKVIEHFKIYGPRTRGGKTLMAPIRARLREGYTADDLIRVIERAQLDPWHIRTTKCLDLKYLMREDSVTRFLAGTDEQRAVAATLDDTTIKHALMAKAFLDKNLEGGENEDD